MGAVALFGLVLVLGANESYAQSGPTDWSSSPTSSEESLERDGVFIGMSFGRGSIDVDCGDCPSGGGRLTEALSLETHVGYMLTPQIALVGEHWTIRYNARGGALFNDNAPHLVAQHVSSLGAQVFIADKVWIRSGFGLGWHVSDGDYMKKARADTSMSVSVDGAQALQPQAPSTPGEADSAGGSYFAAIGWELAHSTSFVAEVQLRAASTYRPDEAYEVRNVGVNVGASWY